jgi:hypothetical protein
MNWIDGSHEAMMEIDSYSETRNTLPGINESVKALRRWHDIIEKEVKRDGEDAELYGVWLALGSTAFEFASKEFGMSSSDIHTILVKKQRDYGPDNIARYGQMGLTIRTHDKIARLENLISSGAEPENESVIDTFIDIVGYSAIAMMWIRGTFLLPME